MRRFLTTLLVVSAVFGDPFDGYEVSQIHIAQGRTPTSMTISWVTKQEASSDVHFGTDRSNLNLAASGYTSSYKFDYPYFELYESGVIHHVSLTNLLADTLYFYQCGDFSNSKTSGLLYFKTLPAVGDSRPFTFGVIGDLGQTNDSISTLQHILTEPDVQMILHAGDLSYADCNQQRWDSYGVLIQDLASQRPWMVCAGNHELELTNDGGAYLAFEERYKMPAIKPAEYGAVTIPASTDSKGNIYCCPSVYQSDWGNSFYSFEAASAHVIYLNCYSTTNETSTQYQWLESDLESIDRTKTPWVIAVFHCPWYNSNTAHYAEKHAVAMRDSMESLFYKYHVNMVFAGHVHAYERTFPIYQNITKSDGVVYVTIGDGGNNEGHASGYYPQPTWSAYRNGTQYGHGEIYLQDKNKMYWRWYRNVDGTITDMDQVEICNSAFKNVFC